MRHFSFLLPVLLSCLIAAPSTAQSIFLGPDTGGGGLSLGYTSGNEMAGPAGAITYAITERIDLGLAMSHMRGRIEPGRQVRDVSGIGPVLQLHPAKQSGNAPVNLSVGSVGMLGSTALARYVSMTVSAVVSRDIDPDPNLYMMPFIGGSFTPILIHRHGASSDAAPALVGGITRGFPLGASGLMTIEPSAMLMRGSYAFSISLGLFRLWERPHEKAAPGK